ncbi:MAG: phosphatase PAP2 family protein [Terracidiphilus sp.]|jgi:membrane-associated phospholipid phosphatase
MAYASSAILIFDIVGCGLTHVLVGGIAETAIVFVIVPSLIVLLVFSGVQIIPDPWRNVRRHDLREAALTIPWAIFLFLLLGFIPDIAARLGMGVDLQDTHFTRLDEWFGVSVPGIVGWASRHWLGQLANKSYPQLPRLILISLLLPALTGKVKQAQQFVTANLVAFAVGMPLFALLPAIGPWYSYHFVASPEQAKCQSDMLLIRQLGPYSHHPCAIVCFPSFHVTWAILCVPALWVFRPLRIPVAVFSGLIVFSTMTTGWHYFCDVLGGILVAAVSTATANWLTRSVSSSQLSHVNISSEEEPLSVMQGSN